MNHLIFTISLFAAQALPVSQYVGDGWCVGAAMFSGAINQIGRIESDGLRFYTFLSEMGCSGMGGFFVHACLSEVIESFRLLLAVSMVVGYGGTVGMKAFANKYLSEKSGGKL